MSIMHPMNWQIYLVIRPIRMILLKSVTVLSSYRLDMCAHNVVKLKKVEPQKIKAIRMMCIQAAFSFEWWVEWSSTKRLRSLIELQSM